MKSNSIFLSIAILIVSILPRAYAEVKPHNDSLRVGFAAIDVTPDVQSKFGVWLAGYGPGRKALGVHDKLFARAVVITDGDKKVAMISVDVVGLQYPTVNRIREKLAGFDYVLVSSTHNHEGPDTIGLWGSDFVHSGVEDAYLDQLVEKSAMAARQAADRLAPAAASYGTADDPELLNDSRLPHVKDGVLRILKFADPSTNKLIGILVQWNCHPEALGSKNLLVTADFPFATVAALESKHHCAVAYFSGAVGGLMAPPRKDYLDGQGKPIARNTFEYAEQYGIEVAGLANRALDACTPINLCPIDVASKPVAIPVENNYYMAGLAVGVLTRKPLIWTGDPESPGSEWSPNSTDRPCILTEVGCLRLGELHVACIPGELYPELVYGKIQDPVEANADYPTAPKEPDVHSMLRDKKLLLIGLANDEVGYILPKRQWDAQSPFAYGRLEDQYGEINSCGPDTAAILLEALKRRIQDLP